MEKIGLISLGCAKNLVDSERMLYKLKEAGYPITPDASEADAVVVNTCGFIDSAKSEAIECVLELAALKKSGRLRKIIVAGCLAQRYRDEILAEMPEVDALAGCGSFGDIVEVVKDTLAEPKAKPQYYGALDAPLSSGPRILSTPGYTAYLKIAEGCDNRCSYCVIPSLRGPFRSREFDSLISEANVLADGGVRELIVVAQDITRYGLDLYGERRLGELLLSLAQIKGVDWIRLHYMYPDEIDDGLIGLIANEPKILKYLDIPIQHIDDGILASMNRRYTGDNVRLLFSKLREKIPGAVLRTSLIVGLPGEGEAEFERLCSFLKTAGLERAGVFPYSVEENTKAAAMDAQVGEDTKLRRAEIVMGILQKSQDAYNRGLRHKTLTVLCEGYDESIRKYYGRSYAESPEIDGRIFFSAEGVKAGDFIDVEIIKAINGDLMGKSKQRP